MKYHSRSLLGHIWESLLDKNPIVNLLYKKSLIEPIRLRIFAFMTSVNMFFSFNAMLFDDQYVDTRALSPHDIRTSFWFTLMHEFFKTILSVFLSSAIHFLLCLIITIPKKLRKSFNEVLITQDKEKIEKAW